MTQVGSMKEPIWFRDEAKVDPSLIHKGSDNEPIRFQDGPKVGPFWIQYRSTKEPRWFQDGSKFDPLMIHDKSEKEPLGFQDGPKWSPSGLPTGIREGLNMLRCLGFLWSNVASFTVKWGFCRLGDLCACVASTGGNKRKKKNNAPNARLQDSQLPGTPRRNLSVS